MSAYYAIVLLNEMYTEFVSKLETFKGPEAIRSKKTNTIDYNKELEAKLDKKKCACGALSIKAGRTACLYFFTSAAVTCGD